ncbi:hypothetical protein INR49_003691 [Caranx melampygus]|nr:hypothetical protein INR49_003691 [Caranx melampygus]
MRDRSDRSTPEGLTPPTTPPHKPVEDELFKPAEGGKGGGGVGGGSSGDGGGGGGGSESVHPASNTNAATKGSSWLSRAHHQRKLPEQTELYAQLRRMGQAGDSDTHRSFGDHDYCVLSLGESRRRSAAMLGAILQAQGGGDGAGAAAPRAADDQVSDGKDKVERLVTSEVAEAAEQQTTVVMSSPPSDCQSAGSEEEAEHSLASRSPSPIIHPCPDSPASKTDSSENSEICPDDKQRNKAKSDEDNCQVFYIHNLPSSVTQNMLRKRFQVFGKAEDCKVIICNEERCGVIKIRQSGVQKHWREREPVFQNGPAGLRRLTRKRYIDLASSTHCLKGESLQACQCGGTKPPPTTQPGTEQRMGLESNEKSNRPGIRFLVQESDTADACGLVRRCQERLSGVGHCCDEPVMLWFSFTKPCALLPLFAH